MRFPLQAQSIAGLDAIEQQLAAITGNGYARRRGFLASDVVLWPRPSVVFAGPRAVRRMRPDQLALLRRAAKLAAPATLADAQRSERQAGAQVCALGDHVAPVGAQAVSALRVALTPVIVWLRRDGAANEAIHRIGDIRSGLGAEAETTPPCTPAHAHPTPTTSLDGSYATTTTRHDLLAHHTPQDLVVPENWGRWVSVLHGGRWAQTQENPQACTWAYGTFAVRGTTLDLTVTDGGGKAPTPALAKPGEHFAYRWSLYRDQLTLHAASGDPELSPNVLRLKPWRRLGAPPALVRLARDCMPPSGALGA